MSLKDDMARDLKDTFINLGEFAETRLVAGKRVDCVMYEDGETPADDYGVSQTTYTLQAEAASMPRIKVGDTLTIDGQVWLVTAYRLDYGMAVVKLQRNR